MCGRTALTASPEDLREALGLDETPRFEPHYNVPPSQPLHVVRVMRDSPGRRLETMRWGLVPSWADDPEIGHRLALARAETALTTPAFRDALRRHRCLVAVDGFYEWKRGAPAKKGRAPGQPFFLRRPDGKPFTLAGVWDRWIAPDGEVVESCAILTQPARAPADTIHDRMPLVIEPGDRDAWLDAARSEPDAIAPMLAPRETALVAYSVGTYVNDPRHDDAACQRAEEPPQGTLF
jgi:putative SOS response-associated peptidase YedK